MQRPRQQPHPQSHHGLQKQFLREFLVQSVKSVIFSSFHTTIPELGREALVKSTSSATSVVRIDAECKPGAECKDQNTCGFIAGTLNVTDEVKQLLGPSEDCFGYTLCPNDLGYNSLVINFLKDGRASNIKIERTEDIGTALTGAKKVAESATTDF